MLLKAAGVGPGDEVITVSQTFIATIGSIVAAGARPFYVDVLDDFTMDPSLLEGAITERTKAIMPVWYSGAQPRRIPVAFQLIHTKSKRTRFYRRKK